MADLFKKIKIANPSDVEGILTDKVKEAKKNKANVLWAIAIDKPGYEDTNILVIVTPTTTDEVLNRNYSLLEKNGRKFYLSNNVEGKVDIVEVK